MIKEIKNKNRSKSYLLYSAKKISWKLRLVLQKKSCFMIWKQKNGKFVIY
jgi:hypothetical protein